VHVPDRVSPGVESNVLEKGERVIRRLERGRLERADSVRRFQSAHVDHDPKHVRLPHRQRSNSQNHGPEAIQKPGGLRADSEQVILVGKQHSQGRHDIGVVQSREEENDGEQGDVDACMKRIRRPRLPVYQGVTACGDHGRQESGQYISRPECLGAAFCHDPELMVGHRQDVPGICQKGFTDSRMKGCINNLQAGRGGDLVIPAPPSSFAVCLGLGDVEELILVNVRRTTSVNHS